MARRPTYNRPARALKAQRASAAIQSVLALRGITDAVRAESLHTEWADLVGPRIAARTRPSNISGRVLAIEVASSAWLQELNLLKQQILTGLLQRMGEPRLFDDLRFRLAGRTGGRSIPQRPRARPAPPPAATPHPATGIAREQIAREVEAVDDLELRELIARVRIGNDK